MGSRKTSKSVSRKSSIAKNMTPIFKEDSLRKNSNKSNTRKGSKYVNRDKSRTRTKSRKLSKKEESVVDRLTKPSDPSYRVGKMRT